MGDDPMALLGLEGALKHYYYLLLSGQADTLNALHMLMVTTITG
jgi:hypothetical protein